MLPKINRTNRKEVKQIFKSGVFVNSNSLSFRFIKQKTITAPKISFIVPKSVFKSSVKRNSLRRVGYNAIKPYIDSFPVGIVGAFIFKKPELNIIILENEIKEIIQKI